MVAGFSAVVNDLMLQHFRVGNGDNHIFYCPDAGDQGGAFSHVSDRLADLDAVVDLQAACIGDDDTGNNIGDQRGRTQRDQEAEEDGNASEYWG